MSLENSEFDDVRQDLDADEPLDGRDSQPAAGSSDAPGALEAEDPLHGVEKVLDENDHDLLGLSPEPLDEQRTVDEMEREEAGPAESLGSDEGRIANLPDQREDPDQQ